VQGNQSAAGEANSRKKKHGQPLPSEEETTQTGIEEFDPKAKAIIWP
jgi:hypothetical protein